MEIRLVGGHHSVYRLNTGYPTTCDIDFEGELRKKAESVQSTGGILTAKRI